MSMCRSPKVKPFLGNRKTQLQTFLLLYHHYFGADRFLAGIDSTAGLPDLTGLIDVNEGNAVEFLG